jgi:AcrR family transcriptional regulator
MSTLSNSAYHHGNLRQALLASALVILERDGEAGLGLRDLARAVGVSPAAPYRHFDSRSALLEALAVTGFQRFTAAMEAVAATRPADPMVEMGQAYVRFALDNANLFRLMFSPVLKKDNRPGLRIAADAAFATLRHVAGDDRHRALAAWAKVHGLAVLLLDGQIAFREGEETEALIAAVVASL